MGFCVDALEPLYREHGLQLRKHTGQFPTWTARVPTVVDLDDDERRILEQQGEAALDEHLRERGMFAFPAVDIRSLKPLHLETTLSTDGVPRTRIFVAPDGHLSDCAGAVCEMIRTLGGAAPTVYPGTEFDLLELAGSHVMVLGGAHENPAAALLCDRGWLDADRRFPGAGGWLLRTVHNPAGLGHNVIHLCGDHRSCEDGLDALRERLYTRGASIVLDGVCEVHPGEQAQAWLGGWEDWKRRLAAIAFWGRAHEHREIEDVEEFARWVATCLDCGGPEHDLYNRGPVRAGSLAARLYHLTGDRRFLQLFRHLLLAEMDYYCNFPGGASYTGDFDFAIYDEVLAWELLEEEDVFSDEERLIVTNFLLAMLHMTRGYQRERWPIEEGRLRHNHETFPALGLFMAGRYFADYYDLDEAEDWLELADATFSGPIERCVKHREDANGYQWLVPQHKLLYDALNGEEDYRDNSIFEGLVHGLIATTDNLGHPAGFGDVGRPISGGARHAALLETIAGRVADPGAQWWAEKLWSAVPDTGIGWSTGLLLQVPGSARVEPREPEPPPTVDVLPLDPHFPEMAAPEMPRAYVCDKIALRDGHHPAGQYLLLDCYSVGSHFHYDQNAIISYTAAERLWLVDNGYGKPSGENGAQTAYSGRELGPQDHNTLLVVGEDGELALPPPFCALLTAETDGPLSLVQSALVGYGGVDWLRSIVWLADCCALVIDRVTVPEDVAEVRCQLNMLGEVELEDGLLRCEQDGRWLTLQFDPSAPVEMGSYTNADWEREFEAGVYPWAEPPIHKFDRVRQPAPGESVSFVTLIHADASPGRGPELVIDSEGELLVRGDLPAGEATVADHSLTARLDGEALSVSFSGPWPVPQDIPRLPATAESYALRPS